MLTSSKALVVHTVKYSNTSLVARLLTREHGLLPFIVKGIRSAKSQSRATLLQPMALLQVVFTFRENKNLLTLRDFQRDYIYQLMPFNPVRAATGMFFIDVIYHAIREQEANPSLYDFIESRFKQLDQPDTKLTLLPHRFLIGLSGYLGFYPMDNYSVSQNLFDMIEGRFISDLPAHHHVILPPESELLHRLLSGKSIDAPRVQRQQLLMHLIDFYRLHITGMGKLQSPHILSTLFHD